MRYNETIFDMADWLTNPPTGGPIQMWCVGGLIAGVTTLYGLGCCVTQRATTLNMTLRGFQPIGRGIWLEISGAHAITFGLLTICIGLFMHFQWFWGNHKRLFPYHELAKYAAALGVIASFIAHAFTMIAYT